MLYRSICMLFFVSALFPFSVYGKTSYGDSCIATGKSKVSCKTKGASLASLCAVNNANGELECNVGCISLKKAAGKCGLFSCDCYETVRECEEGNIGGTGGC